MKKLTTTTLLVCFFGLFGLKAQNISINNNGAKPDSSAMLDISSTDKGLLIPRMTMADRIAILGPATGLIVYQTDTEEGLYINLGVPASPKWYKLLIDGDITDKISDNDSDTRIEVEQLPNEDKIRFNLSGTEFFTMDTVSGTGNVPTARLAIQNNGGNIVIGGGAGEQMENTGGNGVNNVLIGDLAGNDITDGYSNVLIGTGAGQSFVSAQNVGIGWQAGQFGLNRSVAIGNLAGGAGGLDQSVAVGTEAGAAATSTQYSVLMGSYAGYNLNGGNENIFLGYESGYNQKSGSQNVWIGHRSGFNNLSGEKNLFLGTYAGFKELGSEKLYIANDSTTTPLIYGDFAIDSIRMNATVDIAGYLHVPNKNLYVNQGYIGVGTTSPTSAFEGVGSSSIQSRLTTYNSAISSYPSFELRHASGTEAAPLAIPSGRVLGDLSFGGTTVDGSSTFSEGASIRATTTQSWSATGRGTSLYFLTTANNSVSNTIRMTVNSEGNVGIGLTSPNNRFEVAGPAIFRYNTGGISRPSVTHFSIAHTSTTNYLESANGTTPAPGIFQGGTFTFTTGVSALGENSQVLFLDDNGRVSIGGINPGEELDVEGDIEIDNEYRYESAKTHYLSVPAAAFTTTQTQTAGGSYVDAGVGGFASGNARWLVGGSPGADGYLFAPISLPDSARMTSLDLYVYDGDAIVNISGSIIRQTFGSSVATSVATTTATSGSPGTTSVAVSSISSVTGTIDNANYSYYIRVDSKQDNSDLRIYGAKITYTVLKAD
jgi:hypothetical protein